MAENFNMEVKTTAANSPWSNGLLERHNRTLTEILQKLRAENDCEWETALNWALMAKNALHNVHGFSPYQLVYGRNPNLPSVLIDRPPALEGSTMSTVVGKHIEALHSSRAAFTKSECSERNRRALRKQTLSSGDQYQNGDQVYYKRPDSEKWKGPGVVIGQDGSVIFVRYGGICVRVHQCRIRKTNTVMDTTDGPKGDKVIAQQQEGDNCIQENSDSEFEQDNLDEQMGGVDSEDNEANNQQLELKKGQVINLKDTDEGKKHKARLVARGFEEIDREAIPKDSPTCGSDSVRLVLTVLAQRNWSVYTMDIKTAFLKVQKLDARFTSGRHQKLVVKVHGAEVSKSDPAVFFWKNGDQRVDGILACHVDDFLWGGSAEFKNKVIKEIRKTFLVGKEDGDENSSFSYVGIELSKHEKGIELSQYNYQKNIQFIPVDKSRLVDREAALTLTEKECLQSKIGQILWTARQSRPDVIFDASNLASNFKRANVQTLIEANKIIRRIKSEKVTRKFQNLGQQRNMKL
ncbi:uncharacterized protein LOC134267393 [Saccostrea cucullata]|uniref:uncharacterized protein LOC134237225 n=1 Tax=Saccostrea cuccullata TaxID=36930 RepID=UPI002ED325A2